KICQDIKLQRQLKWEMQKTKKELGSFCKQFDISYNPNKSKCTDCTTRKKHKKYTKPKYYPEYYKHNKIKRRDKNYKYQPRKFSQPKQFNKSFQPKQNFNKIVCYKCHQPGHTSKFCKLNRKLHELELQEEILKKIEVLLIESESSSDSENESLESDPQIDELENSTESSTENEISVITKEQQLILEVINQIDNPEIKREYLNKLQQSLNEPSTSSPTPLIKENPYNLTTILEKHKQVKNPNTIPELQREIKIIKQQLQQLTIKQKQDAEAIKFLLQNAVNKEEEEEEENEEEEESEKILSIENSQDIPEDFIYILREITTQKYLIRITLCLTENFQIDTIALFDTGADLNCIKHGIIPSTFISKTQEKLKAA